MTTVLRLDPDNAARSIKVRLDTIQQCEAYIRETVTRYDGLRAFEAKLADLGIADAAHKLAGGEE